MQPAATLYAWATGLPWEKVLTIAKMEEGDLRITSYNVCYTKLLRTVAKDIFKYHDGIIHDHTDGKGKARQTDA